MSADQYHTTDDWLFGNIHISWHSFRLAFSGYFPLCSDNAQTWRRIRLWLSTRWLALKAVFE